MSYLHIYKQSVQIFIHMQRFTVITFSILQSSDIKILRYGMKYPYSDIHDCAKICLNKTLKKHASFVIGGYRTDKLGSCNFWELSISLRGCISLMTIIWA